MRLLWIFLALSLLLLAPFLLWGERFEAIFTLEGAVGWLRGFGRWGWLAAIGLLAADLFLPIPGTVVLAALGLVYGPFGGGGIGAAGSFGSGLLAYALCRLLGRGAAVRIAGARELARGERLFARFGGWMVVASRWLPVLPEAVACMAGLTRMPAPRFCLALACGAVPVAFTFATLGHLGQDRPAATLLASALLPPLLWLAARPLLRVRPSAIRTPEIRNP